jgi:hypothetical protein
VDIVGPVPRQGLVWADGVVVDAVALGVHGQVEDVVDLFEEQPFVFQVSDRVAARSSRGAWRTSGRSVVAPSADHAGPILRTNGQVTGCVHGFGRSP